MSRLGAPGTEGMEPPLKRWVLLRPVENRGHAAGDTSHNASFLLCGCALAFLLAAPSTSLRKVVFDGR